MTCKSARHLHTTQGQEGTRQKGKSATRLHTTHWQEGTRQGGKSATHLHTTQRRRVQGRRASLLRLCTRLKGRRVQGRRVQGRRVSHTGKKGEKMHLKLAVAVAHCPKHQQPLSQSEPFAHNPPVCQTVSRHPAPMSLLLAFPLSPQFKWLSPGRQ